jgi:hypothetical protein
MILPRHTQGHFYNPKSSNKSVLIYEHLGNESDRASYPQCEVIVQWDRKSEDFTKIFQTNTKFIKGVNKIYSILNQEYFILNRLNKAVSIDYTKIILTSQFIDQYGKVRALKFNNGKNIKKLLNRNDF